jgi:DNA-binding response OmpR family regulator
MSQWQAIIIEDDQVVANIYAEALRLAGYEPEIIHNGRNALSRLAETVPALVLLDLHLPEVQGEEILQSVRADARLSSTKIIITTADPILAEAFREQVDLVLLKPISFAQLRDLTLRMRPG